MPKATDEGQQFYQNLVDIGCGEEMIQYCIRLKDECRLQELIIALKRQRKKLLDRIHMGQQKLDCLDYLLNQIEKKQIEYLTKNGGYDYEHEIQF